MNPILLSLIIGTGIGVWIFSKLNRRTGAGNNREALIAAVFVGVIVFVVVYIFASKISNS